MASKLKFFKYLLISTGWLFGSAVVIGKAFGPGLAYGWHIALLVILGGYALIVLYAATRKNGAAASMGALFLPGSVLAAYILMKTVPVSSLLYPVIFTDRENSMLEGKVDKPTPGLDLIYLPDRAHCSHGPCREILFETRYGVAYPRTNDDGWVIYKIGTGDACTAPDNLGRTLNLLRQNILGRCIVSEIRNTLPTAILVERYRPEVSPRESMLIVRGWEVRERIDGNERELGGWVWGAALNPLGSSRSFWVDKTIGREASDIEVLNAALGLNLDGLVEPEKPANSAEILEFLKPYLFHSEHPIRYKAIKKVKAIIAGQTVDVRTRGKYLTEISDMTLSMLNSGAPEKINIGLGSISTFDRMHFHRFEPTIVSLALSTPPEGVDETQLLLRLRDFGGPKQPYSEETRNLALAYLKGGDDLSQMRVRRAFLLATSGGAEFREEAFKLLMSLDSPRHEEIVTNLALGSIEFPVRKVGDLWSESEIDRLLARARTLPMPALVPYLEALRFAITRRNREDMLASVLRKRSGRIIDHDERLNLRAFAGTFKIKIPEGAN
jgi:hypothetical protein